MEERAVLAWKKREGKKEKETLIIGSFPENPRTSVNKKETSGKIQHMYVKRTEHTSISYSRSTLTNPILPYHCGL